MLLQLLIYDGLGDWNYINEWAEKTLAVTVDDVKRVTTTYFEPSNRAVAHYYRKDDSAPVELPTELEGLPPQMQQRIMSQLEHIRASENLEELKGMLEQLPAYPTRGDPHRRRSTSQR